MCGRYVISPDRDVDLWRAIHAAMGRTEAGGAYRAEGEIRPGDTVPVIAAGRGGRPAAFAMRWGYSLSDGRRVINIRSETAGEKAAFRDSLRLRRCAVPASWYFEWERHGHEKVRYAIEPSDGGPLFMAGLYRAEGKTMEFAILTRDPAEEIAFIHDRMPAVLTVELAGLWIRPDTDPAALLRHLDPKMRYEAAGEGPEQMRMEF